MSARVQRNIASSVRILPNINRVTVADVQISCCQFGPILSKQVVDRIKNVGVVTSWDQLVMTGFPADGKRMQNLMSHFSLATVTTVVSTRKLNINTASVKDLMTIPGIGKVLSKSIADHIDDVGGIASINELIEVVGNGQRLISLKEFCRC